MKKALSILLVLVLVLALAPAALAEDQIVVSPQNLCVDGAMADCMKYNINGYNYLMLRDVAMLVNGTGSQFSVSYDTEKRTVSVVTGEAYEPNGSELDTTLGDQSDSAVPSNQPILINGVEHTDLEAYNIGGHNFIKFRDLGRVLGFHTEYEAETNTAIIVTKVPTYPVKWLIEESSYSGNDGYWTHGYTEYSEEGLILTSFYEGEGYYRNTEYTYDELGRTTKTHAAYANTFEGEVSKGESTTTYTYNLRGLLAEEVTEETGDIVYGTTYTYDDRGNVLTQRYRSNAAETLYTYTYDEYGGLIRDVTESEYGTYTVNYVRDAEGNILREWNVDSEGLTTYTQEYVYEGGLLMQSNYTSGSGEDQSTYSYSYTYDADGNCILEEAESSYGETSITRHEYDDRGREVKYTYESLDYVSVTTYTYDENDRLLRSEDWTEGYGDEDRTVYVDEYTYDDEGNVLRNHSTNWNSESETTYTYDLAARKRTAVTVTTFEPPEELALEMEELTLALGESYWMYSYFSPYNASKESVIWSSSDPAVASVDESGNITALAAGTAVITATSDPSGLKDSCTVTVKAEKYTLSAEPVSIAVRKGQTVGTTFTLSCAGQWTSVHLTYDNNDEEKIDLEWDPDGWTVEKDATIVLNVTGLATGKASFRVSLCDADNEPLGPAVSLNVVVAN